MNTDQIALIRLLGLSPILPHFSNNPRKVRFSILSGARCLANSNSCAKSVKVFSIKSPKVSPHAEPENIPILESLEMIPQDVILPNGLLHGVQYSERTGLCFKGSGGGNRYRKRQVHPEERPSVAVEAPIDKILITSR